MQQPVEAIAPEAHASPTAALSECLVAVRYDDLPPAVVARTVDLFLDWFACALAGKGARPVRVDVDVWDILCRCEEHRRATGGYFDVTAASGASGSGALVLDAERRTVHIVRPEVFIDFGGFAKGYALDRGAVILRRFGVTCGLLNGGTSSILAVGRHPDGEKWPIDVRDPFGEEASPP